MDNMMSQKEVERAQVTKLLTASPPPRGVTLPGNRSSAGKWRHFYLALTISLNQHCVPDSVTL